jgi:hypothetical protein
MKILITLLLAIFISSQAYAQDSYKDILDYEIPEGTVSLCKEKHSSGYNWRNGEWVEANYDTAEYIIKKIAYKDIDKSDISKSFDCKKIDDKINDIANDIYVFADKLHRCYSVREFGKELMTVHYQICKEWYFDNKLYSVNCYSMGEKTVTFVPNGLFVRRHIYADVTSKPNKDYKDSMVLSHGVCATIN